MAKQWFRWYKDTSSDAKFKMIAMDVSSYGADDPTYGRNVQPAEVVGVWACILERADDDTGIVTVCSPLHNGGAVTAYVGSALDLEGIVAHRIVQSMVEHGLLVNEGEVYRIKNWQSRQYVDATNAERQARFRRNRSNGVTVTPTETETETDSKNQIRPKEATDGLDALFDDFWKVYPRREAKGGARLAFRRAMKRAAFAEIMAGARLYAAQRAGKEKQYTAMAQTWLNQDRWLDEAEDW